MKINVYLTQRCNFSCRHCLDKCPVDRELPFEKYKELLKRYPISEVYFTGGEPILHTRFDDIIKETVKKNIPFSLVSNGTFLDRYSSLFKYEDLFSRINLSINGLEEIHDKIRKKGSFSQVVKAIRFYKENDIDVVINYQVVNGGEDEFEDLIKFMSEQNVKKIKVAAIIKNEINKNLIISMKKRKELYWKIVPLSKKYDVPITVSPALYSSGGVEMCKVFGDRTNFDLDVNGTFYFCCNLKLDLGTYAQIGDKREKILGKRDSTAMKIRDNRILRMMKNQLSEEKEYTCEYCNKFFSEV